MSHSPPHSLPAWIFGPCFQSIRLQILWTHRAEHELLSAQFLDSQTDG